MTSATISDPLGYGDKWTSAGWAFSMLSDAQELIAMGDLKEANETINRAKRVLQGEYEQLDRTSIRVFEPKEVAR